MSWKKAEISLFASICVCVFHAERHQAVANNTYMQKNSIEVKTAEKTTAKTTSTKQKTNTFSLLPLNGTI